MPSTPLRQMYKLRQYIGYIYSQAEQDMELDHKDHPFGLTKMETAIFQYIHEICHFLTQERDEFIPCSTR